MAISSGSSSESKGVPEVPWTPLRKAVFSWIKNYSPSLAELYEAALRLLFDKNFPGRVALIAHAVREIQNSLPVAVLGEAGRAGRNDPTELLKELTISWKDNRLPLDESSLEGLSVEGAAPPTIPLPTVRLIALILKQHNEPTQERKTAFAKLFEHIVEDNRPSPGAILAKAQQWLNIQEWFYRFCHNDRRGSVRQVDEKELIEKFDLFEITLGAPIQEFFKTKKAVDDLLAETN